MDEQAVNTVKKGFCSFLPIIRFRSVGDPNMVIKQAIYQDPTIIYYLYTYTICAILGGYEIRVQYMHRDTDRSDIHIILSLSECEKLIYQYVGNYRKKLIAIAKSSLNLSEAITMFYEKHVVFFPNLINIKGMYYRSDINYSAFEFVFEYRVGQVKLAQMEQEVNYEVQRISKLLFKPNMPVESKIYLAHNYLATTVKYVNDHDNRLAMSYTQSAYGALVKKQCVCQGYSEAFKRLMDVAGIKCTVICGQIEGLSVPHAWNLVSIDGGNSYYHIDVTWDSAGDRPGYIYFCKNDAYFSGKRSWNKHYNPTCTGSYPVLTIARKYVFQNRNTLIASGIDKKVLDC